MTRHALAQVLLAGWFVLTTSCSELSGSSPFRFSISIEEGVGTHALLPSQNEAPSTIRVDIWEAGRESDPPSHSLVLPPTGQWMGTLDTLSKDKPLVFFARAHDASGQLLFSGSTDQTLRSDDEQVGITIAPASADASYPLPRIDKIASPEEIFSDEAANIAVTVTANTGERLTYTLLSGEGESTFLPASGPLILFGPSATFVILYVPPEVETDTDFTYSVQVANEAGQSIISSFKTKVKKPRGSKRSVRRAQVRALFNPVIESLSASRLVGTQSVRWEAHVSDDEPADALSYAWSFTSEDSTQPPPAFTLQANPTLMEGYTPSQSGTLTLRVTDSQGGTTTLFSSLRPNQFPDQVIEQGHLQFLHAGQHHTCVLVDDGSVRCWGRNDFGQLGLGHTISIGDDELPFSAGPVALTGAGTRMAPGGHHSCALLDTGLIHCWGRNDSGQLGLGHTQLLGDDEPVSSHGSVHLDRRVIRLAAGLEHTCALQENRRVRCWGRNDFGQLGLGHTRPVGGGASPWLEHEVDVGGPVQNLTAGGWHTCALLMTGKVRCWGRNDSGQLGLGHTHSIGDDGPPSSAGYVNLGGIAAQLAAGLHHTCALLTTGSVRCWGLNADGQLGLGHTSNIGDNEFPVAGGFVDAGARVQQLVAGNSHTCALLVGGGIKCWGANAHGQLGLGDTTRRNAPPNAFVDAGSLPASQLAAGGWHTCALLTHGGLRCWGRNDSGQLGLGHSRSIGDDELPSTAGDVPVLAPPSLTSPPSYTPVIL